MSERHSNDFSWPKRVKTAGQAVRFIDAAGFCMLFPVKNVPLPSLYYAAARRLPISWDKTTQMIWDWKDDLPLRRRAFYAKYFRARGTFISLKFLPQFLAMRESAAGPGAAADFYAAGLITQDARVIWEVLAGEGPLATLELRHACKMAGTSGNARFKRAMLELQCLLIVTHFGAARETEAWASNRFELVSRAFPKQFKQARGITPKAARAVLAQKYRSLHPDAPVMQIARLFGWPKPEAQAALG
jgi:hypothetical protein